MQRDRDAFTRQWAAAETAVAAYLRAFVRDRTACEDLLQEVALAGMDAYATRDPDRPFMAWILTIAKYKALDHLRASRRERLWIRDPAALAQVAAAAVELAPECERRSEALRECLRGLEGRARRVIDGHYCGGLPLKAVAERLELGLDHVKVILHRARNQLRRCIEIRLRREAP